MPIVGMQVESADSPAVQRRRQKNRARWDAYCRAREVSNDLTFQEWLKQGAEQFGRDYWERETAE